ncbi:MAG: GspE/PulE family protein [Patescibacteria group bacterium]
MDILDVLVSQLKIDQKTANKIRIDSITQNKDVEELIFNMNIVNKKDFYIAKASVINIPFKDLTGITIRRDIFNKISINDIKDHTILPFEEQSGGLSLAMANPLDSQLIQYLESKYNVHITPYLAMPEEIQEIVSTNMSEQIESKVVEDVEAAGLDFDVEDVTGSINDLGNITGDIKNAPIVKIVNTVLEYAVKFRASDIHIEPERKRLRFRYRIDGILQEKLSIPLSLAPAVISRIKILSKLKIDEKRMPQDGRFSIKVEKELVDLRISTLPIVYGEKIVIRLLRKGGGIPKLEDVGITGVSFEQYKKGLSLTKGIILITGPTGSGKTQTLAASLAHINNDSVNIETLEDPVEIEIDGVNQVQVNDEVGLTFPTGLRAFLRQDPNIIMVGEIRDEETARLATQASLTGHLVFSTIHTTSAAGALPRLLDMGIEPFLISSTIEIVVAQRLVRTICQTCKEDYVVDKSVVAEITKELEGSNIDISKYIQNSSQTNDSVLYLSRGKGCDACNNTGYLGRIGIFEVLIVNDVIRDLILKKASTDEIDKVARSNNMMSLVQNGFLKVLDKITTLEEVYRVAKEDIE